jgi:N-acetylmuramoyl-L-alanine amidase
MGMGGGVKSRASTRVRRPVAATLFAVALLGPSSSAATNILAIRHWSAPDHTRIVLDLDGPASYRHRDLVDPHRIAVDVAGGRFRFSLDPIWIEDGLIRRVRFNVLKNSGKAQVVLDLDSAARYDVFALEKFGAKPNRIVVDVKRPSPAPGPSRPRVERNLGPDAFGDFIVMIDPGHGGEDPGRRNPGGLKEKNLALTFSRELQTEVDRRRGYRAELTRNGDYFVSLRRRREIAEERGAHLFVSVHFNAASARSARGTEVFFVSLRGAEDRATKELVHAENSADLVGGVPPRDLDTADALGRMLVDLRQHDSVERSQRLATLITDNITGLRGMRTRRVQQAGFGVLKSLFIPAVLVEAGFLTNSDDVHFFRSSADRARYIRALVDGIVMYCEEVEIPRLGWTMHTVSTGESLSQIAQAYAMDVDSLKGANNLNSDQIFTGQRLRVRPR